MNDGKEYRIPDAMLTDLANSVACLRMMSQHYPRLDWLGQANLDMAADHMQAILDITLQQHPVEDQVIQVVIAR